MLIAFCVYQSNAFELLREFLALNIYISLCYYKLDYFDISQEVLDTYLTRHADSIIAINLKACNRFRLFDGRAAEGLIRNIVMDRTTSAATTGGDRAAAGHLGRSDAEDDAAGGTFGRELLRHNLVVFRGGEGALQVFPALLDIVPEARLNLAIYYMRGGDVQRAEELIRNVQPSVSYEYVLKGAVHAALAQQLGSVKLWEKSYCNIFGFVFDTCHIFPYRKSI